MAIRMKKLLSFFIIFALLLTISGCAFYTDEHITNVGIYKDTPVWELAKAVKNNNTWKIKSILKKNPELVDYQDPKYGATLLIWAVGTEHYNSAKALLECGANPDIICTHTGGTALYTASGYSWVDNFANKDAKYVQLLLEHGADPNIGFAGSEYNNIYEIGTTPLMRSIGCGIEKTKALVEGGADINYQLPESKETAAIIAINHVWSNTLDSEMIYAYYLIVEKKADISQAHYYGKNFEGETIVFSPVDDLRRWTPDDLESEGYQMKMAIVEEFKKNGYDYWATEVPQDIIDQYKKLYPDTWKDYIDKY